ncbi:MAG: DUF502 domain-containing protein [Rhizobiales bacterium]|nr:DUF502 domain-containing protein [Hyphomicrobiales bacterium]
MANDAPNSSPLKSGDSQERSGGAFFGRIKTYFFTGLVIAAPIAITLWATYWFVTLFDQWVKPVIPSIYTPEHYLPFSVPGVGLLFTLICITLIGALAANLVGRTLISYWEYLLNRMPIVRSLYKGTKQIFQTIVSQSGGTFRQVALIEFPRKGLYTLFFISREMDGAAIGLEPGRRMYAAYLTTTPNPTSGFLYFFDVAEARILDMNVEDALKLIISCGLVFPDGTGSASSGTAMDRKTAEKVVAAATRQERESSLPQ